MSYKAKHIFVLHFLPFCLSPDSIQRTKDYPGGTAFGALAPRKMPATLKSSSISSQCIPNADNLTLARCCGVAANNLGYHQSGVRMMTPLWSSTSRSKLVHQAAVGWKMASDKSRRSKLLSSPSPGKFRKCSRTNTRFLSKLSEVTCSCSKVPIALASRSSASRTKRLFRSLIFQWPCPTF